MTRGAFHREPGDGGLGPLARQVLDAVREHGPVYLGDLVSLLPEIKPSSLRDRLRRLEDLDYVMSQRVKGTPRFLYCCTDRLPPPLSEDGSPMPSVSNGQVAGPRVLSMMNTTCPPDARLVARPGAFDFLQCHSLIGNRRVPMAEQHHDPR